MKKLILHSCIIGILFTLFSIASCEDTIEETRTYTVNVPKYMTKENLRKAVKIAAPRALENPGKIYLYGKYILINEKEKGIHVYNNSNPELPRKISFIEIPGNIDMSVKNNRLFADSYIDLVVFDVRDMNNVKEINRLENVFEGHYPQPNWDYPCDWGNGDEGIIVGWELEERTEEIEYKEVPIELQGRWFIDDMVFETNALSNSSGGGNVKAVQNTVGTGGSMARFRIYKDYLYIAKNWTIKVMDISDLNNPIQGDDIYTSVDVETVFIARDKMFIGATTGMAIYDLARPEAPEFMSMFAHVNSCDPVVVDDKYAYVTLRSGNACLNQTDQLDVINIEDLYNPKLEKTYKMDNPHGLGVEENLLFICDGDAGLKIYDKTDIYNIDQNMVQHYRDMNAYDVIPMQGLLIMIGADGLYQYDYNNIDDIKFLSQIDTRKN